jgi:shikimate dehydrogenase
VKKQAVLIGLIGADIQGSAAPEMHMAEGECLDLRYIYRLIDLTRLRLGVDALPGLLHAAEQTGFNGLAITHPCKQAVIPYLTELSDDARALGAVNTVVLSEGRRIGHNTDWIGFAEAFRRNMPKASKRRVVQLGAGGAGAAVAHAGLTLGFDVLTVFDMDPQRASQVVGQLIKQFGDGRAMVGTNLEEEVAAADGLVNATPIGMDAHPGMPLSAGLLRPDLWVSDVVYFPRETELLSRARALGAQTANGGDMAVFQAAEQFRIFTGRAPDIDRMLNYFGSIGK